MAPKHQGLYSRTKSGKAAWMPESSMWEEPRQKAWLRNFEQAERNEQRTRCTWA